MSPREPALNEGDAPCPTSHSVAEGLSQASAFVGGRSAAPEAVGTMVGVDQNVLHPSGTILFNLCQHSSQDAKGEGKHKT